jgi:hypothetical protein
MGKRMRRGRNKVVIASSLPCEPKLASRARKTPKSLHHIAAAAAPAYLT